jgi:hypothetical protein
MYQSHGLFVGHSFHGLISQIDKDSQAMLSGKVFAYESFHVTQMNLAVKEFFVCQTGSSRTQGFILERGYLISH